MIDLDCDICDFDEQYYLPEQVSSLFWNGIRDNFSIFHLNIRSFNKNSDDLSVVLDQLGPKPDVIVLTETWFSSDNCNGELPGFSAQHVFRSDRRGGGVSVYIKNKYKSHLIPQWSFISENLEICSVSVTVSNKRVIVHGIYRPPDRDVRIFTDEVVDIIGQVGNDERDHVLLVGDMNIDLVHPTAAHTEFANMCYASSFVPLIRLPTHIGVGVSTCIDHVWYNRWQGSKSGVISVDITDHYPVFVIIPIKCEVGELQRKYFRDHSQGTLARLRDGVSCFVREFSDTLDDGDIDASSAMQSFIDGLYSIYDTNCPIRCKVLPCGIFRKPWISNQLRNCIQRKHVLFRLYKRGTVSFQTYNTYKNVITRILKRKKSEYFSRKFQVIGSDARGTWREINTLIGRKNSNKPLSELVHDGITCSAPQDIANSFNTYFTNVAAELDRKIPVRNIRPTSYMGDRNSSSFFINPALTADVRAAICGLKNKSSGLYCVPVFIYKTCADLLYSIIARLFNMSVSSGVFPTCLKSARVIPVFKSGDPKLPGNYRPISNLSIMSKIFEKIMSSKLNAFLKSNNILFSGQFGFRKNCSTADAVLEFIDNVNNTLDHKMCMVTVFLDFSKAFDTVRHEVLIDKLDHLGVRGLALEWFASYLCDRNQYVEVSGASSDLRVIRSGVPQGSVLGPILFLLYINDMNKCSDRLDFVHFADDTTVYASNSDICALSRRVNEGLSRIYDWLCSNRLSINISKTCTMVMSDMLHCDLPNIRINNMNIDIVKEAKFLGVIIDSGLTFKAHVDCMCRKISRNIGMMNRVSSLISTNAKKSIYFCLIYSYVIYCIAVWGRSSLGNCKQVERLLHKAAKIVSFLYPVYSGPTERFLNFHSSYNYFTLTKLFRVINSNQHPYFKNHLDELVPSHEYSTRFRFHGNFQPPHYVKAKCQKNFFYQSIGLWNELPVRIKSCESFEEFKILLKRELIMVQHRIGFD